jgi:hypothetical protein
VGENKLKVQSRTGRGVVDIHMATLGDGKKKLADRTEMQIAVGKSVPLISMTPKRTR